MNGGGGKVTAVVHGVRRGEQRRGSAEPWKIATVTGGRIIGSDYWINETLTRELYHQGHMMWLQRQDTFKQKFGTLDDQKVVDDQQDSTQDLS